jgi:mono/diheme cytochrome c family protein
MKHTLILLTALMAQPVLAQDTSPQALINQYSAEAGVAASPENGQALFMATHSGGKPDTPSCTTCHSADPTKGGQARTGKPIDPLSPTANPERFTNTKFVEKWFGRNCNSVLGRDCSAQEKADIIAWLMSL